MISSKNILTAALLLVVGTQSILRAEDEGAEAAKNDWLKKVGFLRVWYVGTSRSPRVTICSKPDGKELIVLGSHLRAGSLKNYHLLKPGRYTLMALAGSVIPDENGRIPDTNEPLFPPQPIQVKPGSYHTAVISERDGKFVMEIHEDTQPADPQAEVFQLYDYSNMTDGSVRLIAGKTTTELWKAGNPSPSEKMLSGLSGVGRIELVAALNGNEVCYGAYELELTRGSSTSIVLYFDRYKKRVLSVTPNADLIVTEQEVKDFLKE